MAEKIVLAIWVAWLLVSVLVYVPGLTRHIRAFDMFSLVPEWKFFAPVPARGDYHLLFRDQYPDGSTTGWTEVNVALGRDWWNFVWNPGRRGRKAFFDSMMELVRYAKEAEELPIEGSIPYLTLLNHISERQRLAPPDRTQFMIMYSHGSQSDLEPEVAVISAQHRL